MRTDPPLLKSVEYTEFDGTDRSWSLRKADFETINLIVGRNASGKTRLLNVINGLATLLTSQQQSLWVSGTYTVDISYKEKTYTYHISFKDRAVESERLMMNGETVLNREKDGSGTIRAEEINQSLKFKIPTNSIAAFVRRDEIQHLFLEPLFGWASSVRRYEFGSELGKPLLQAYSPFEEENEASSEAEYEKATDPRRVVKLYISGFSRFGKRFDKAILRDFASVGYNCEEVGAYPFKDLQIPNTASLPIGIYVKESDLSSHTRQIEMSMGMYRCLALIINLNYVILTRQANCILIDDIGEGIDFERSVKLISLLVAKCKTNKLQLIMSSNDRFVMNHVDLKYWRVIHREGNVVKLLSKKNSRKAFEDFKFLGLSNFDFFASQAYLGNQD